MSIYANTDAFIARELGSRLDRLRLDSGWTRAELAAEVGVSVPTLRRLMRGQGSIITVIAVLRALGRLDEVDNFVPAPTFSPIKAFQEYEKSLRKARVRKPSREQSDSPPPDIDW